MPDKLKTLQKVMDEHYSLRDYIKLAGDQASDMEAALDLQRAQADWTLTALGESWPRTRRGSGRRYVPSTKVWRTTLKRKKECSRPC